MNVLMVCGDGDDRKVVARAAMDSFEFDEFSHAVRGDGVLIDGEVYREVIVPIPPACATKFVTRDPEKDPKLGLTRLVVLEVVE